MDEFDGSYILAAIACTVIAWWVIRSLLIAQMSNVAEAIEAKNYLVKDSVTLTDHSDTYVCTKVSRTPRSKKK